MFSMKIMQLKWAFLSTPIMIQRLLCASRITVFLEDELATAWKIM